MTSPTTQLLNDRLQTATRGNGRRFTEIGHLGLKHYGGVIDEEPLLQLRGERGFKALQEMRDNSPIVGALLFAVEALARQASWHIERAGDTDADRQAAELIKTGLEDMSSSFDATLAEILSMLPYGWSYHEIVYKVRQGQQRQPGLASQYDDGLIAWRKLPIRAQETRWRWELDEGGGVKGLHQWSTLAIDKPAFIPIEKALLFRPTAYKNNPEGRSILRNAWIAYYYMKRIQEIEAVGIERDLAGLPVMRIPAEVMADSTKFAQYKALIADVRRNEQAGLVYPSDLYEGTSEPMYAFELVNSGGERQVDTNQVIARYEKQILQTALADFIAIGHQNVGSKALVGSRIDLFIAAHGGWMNSIAEVFNRHAIPRLVGLNQLPVDLPPRLVFDTLEVDDVLPWIEAIAKIAGAGMALFPDPNLENVVRAKLDLPEMTEDEIADREAQDALEEQRKEDEREQRMAAMTEMNRARTDAMRAANPLGGGNV